MVACPTDAGAWSFLPGGDTGKECRASARQFRVFRVCALAEGNAPGRSRPPTLVVLEQTVMRRGPRPRFDDGQSKAACSNLWRQLTSIQAGSRVDGEIEEFGASAQGHHIYDAIGGISGAAAQIHG